MFNKRKQGISKLLIVMLLIGALMPAAVWADSGVLADGNVSQEIKQADDRENGQYQEAGEDGKLTESKEADREDEAGSEADDAGDETPAEEAADSDEAEEREEPEEAAEENTEDESDDAALGEEQEAAEDVSELEPELMLEAEEEQEFQVQEGLILTAAQLTAALDSLADDTSTVLLIAADIEDLPAMSLSGRGKEIILRGVDSQGNDAEDRILSAESASSITIAANSEITLIWDSVALAGELGIVINSGSDVRLKGLVATDSSVNPVININDASVAVNNSTFTGNTNRVIHAKDAVITIENSTLKDNSVFKANGGAIYAKDSEITVTGSIFDGNEALSDGVNPYSIWGGAMDLSSSALTIKDSTFANNIAAGDAGAIKLNGGELNILEGSQFYGNSSPRTGAIYAGLSNGETTVKIAGTEANPVKVYENTGNGIQLQYAVSTISHAHIWDNEIDGSGGGLYLYGGSAKIADIKVFDNSAQVNGGGVLLNQANVELKNSVITDNQSGSYAGGIYIGNRSEVEMDNVTLSGNSSSMGGALYATGSAGSLSIKNSTLEENHAGENGGAMYLQSIPTTVTNCVLQENTAGIKGAGIQTYNNVLNITDSFILENKSERSGAGLFIWKAEGEISNTEISGNETEDGGGLYLTDSSCVLEQVTVADNVASDYGAGFYLTYNSSLELKESAVSGNLADGAGGGIFVENSKAFLRDTVVEENHSGTAGGAIYLWWGEVQIADSSLLDNEARDGGGIYVVDGVALVTGVEISGNEASRMGGGAYIWDYEVESVVTFADDTVFDGNTAVRSGGAVYSNGAAATISKVGFTNNKSEDNGGALCFAYEDLLRSSISEVTFSGNEAREYVNVLSDEDVSQYQVLLAEGAIREVAATSLGDLSLDMYRQDDSGEKVVLAALPDSGYEAYNNYDIAYNNVIYKTDYQLGSGAIDGSNQFVDHNRYGTGVASAEADGAEAIPLYVIEATVEPQGAAGEFLGWAKNAQGDTWAVNEKEQQVFDLNELADDTVQLFAQYSERVLAVTFDANGGVFAAEAADIGTLQEEDGKLIVTVSYGADVADPSGHMSRAGYSFKGWYLDGEGAQEAVLTEITESNTVFYAKWESESDGGNGGGGNGGGGNGGGGNGGGGNGGGGNGGGDNGGGNGGGNSGGSSDGGRDTEYPQLEREKRIPYISGYTDGTVRPEGYMTRAEVSMALFRLITENNKQDLRTPQFYDVNDEAWYGQAVAYLAEYDVLAGYDDGGFRPDHFITRAEFTAVISRFGGLEHSDYDFTDVPADHWAAEYIANAYLQGWINGYPDGSFRPENYITRAEAVTIINLLLGRTPQEGTFTAEQIPYLDLQISHWAWQEILEATLEDLQ